MSGANAKEMEFLSAENLSARTSLLGAEGYETLLAVFVRALFQAAHGKGKERHAAVGEPFEGQMMQDMARRFGVGALLGQAFKKSEESQRLPHDRAVAELLGAINYLAGAVIAMERAKPAEFEAEPVAANDNAPKRAGPVVLGHPNASMCCSPEAKGLLCRGCPRV